MGSRTNMIRKMNEKKDLSGLKKDLELERLRSIIFGLVYDHKTNLMQSSKTRAEFARVYCENNLNLGGD